MGVFIIAKNAGLFLTESNLARPWYWMPIKNACYEWLHELVNGIKIQNVSGVKGGNSADNIKFVR